MHSEVEISSIDSCYEGRRLKNRARERQLLSSIAERGIEDPLEGVDMDGRRVLLNGFKRYRCARKLGLETVPYTSLGDDAVSGIVALLRVAKTNHLTILEQAGFIDELRGLQNLSVAEIAAMLSRSKSWVVMRMGLINELSATVRQKLFNDAFPVYAYMYTIRRIMRITAASKQDVDSFVVALSGKNLSLREIELLAHGYFRGPSTFREEVLAGNINLALDRIMRIPDDPDGCSPFERGLLSDLERVAKTIRRASIKSTDKRLKSRAFHAEANLLTADILGYAKEFIEAIRRLHDRSGQA